jgi:hypothetical protein
LLFCLVRAAFWMVSLLPNTSEALSRMVDGMSSPKTATAPWWAGSRLQMTDPLVKEQSLSDLERKGNDPQPEPRKRLFVRRWRRRLKHLRKEAGLSLVRGASTAAGGVLVTYGALWLQARF